jgi:hypothetical protein
MRSHVDEHVEVIERDLGRFGLVRCMFHPARLGESADHRHRSSVSSSEGRWHPSDEAWRHRWHGVVDHNRPVKSDRKACREQRGEMYRFLEGAAALRGGGESEQVSDRPRSKDRDPESAHVLVRGGVPSRRCRCEHRFDHRAYRCRHTDLRLRHARAWRTSFLKGRTNLTETRPGRVRSIGKLHTTVLAYKPK